MNRTTLATLAGLAGYSIFGFSFLFSKLALDVAEPFVLLSVRFLIAFALLNLLVVTGRARLDLRGKSILPLLALGLMQPILYFICESYGISLTSSSFSGMMLGLVPVVGLVLGRLFLHERCSGFRVACALGSIVGIVMTSVGGETVVSVRGTMFLLGAVLTASLFTVISRGISGQFTAFERTYVMFALACVVFTSVALVQNRNDLAAALAPLKLRQFWISVIYLAAVSSVCAFLLINYAMNDISVAVASVFSNFTAVISVLAGIFILGDSFTLLQLAGVVLVTLCVFGASWPGKQT